MSDFLNILTERGFLHQATDREALQKRMESATISAYIGFDATADSLHVGSLLPIMMLYWLQQTGHKPIVLMGGGTTKVGDPSGKDESRKLLSDADIANNIIGIQKIFSQFLSFDDAPHAAVMVNNDDWLSGLAYIPFLRDIGKHFTINRMLTFDSVKTRLEREQPLTFLEFNYMILQAYDFMELANRHGCALQMGGSDQWGNIINGVELTRRVTGKEVFGLTCPLLTTASGAKMGKTASGAVWLNAERLSPYDYWQYWRNTEDADVGKFLKLFTILPLSEIARLETLQGAEINDAKKILAFEATKLCHGEGAATQAAETARQTFEAHGMATGLATITLPANTTAIGMLDLFVQAGLASSKSEARRLIQGKGAKLNDIVIQDESQIFSLSSLDKDGVAKLSAGKKHHVLVKISEI